MYLVAGRIRHTMSHEYCNLEMKIQLTRPFRTVETLKKYKPSEPQAASEMMPPPPPGELNGKGKGRAVTVEDDDVEAEYSRGELFPIEFDIIREDFAM